MDGSEATQKELKVVNRRRLPIVIMDDEATQKELKGYLVCTIPEQVNICEATQKELKEKSNAKPRYSDSLEKQLRKN